MNDERTIDGTNGKMLVFNGPTGVVLSMEIGGHRPIHPFAKGLCIELDTRALSLMVSTLAGHLSERLEAERWAYTSAAAERADAKIELQKCTCEGAGCRGPDDVELHQGQTPAVARLSPVGSAMSRDAHLANIEWERQVLPQHGKCGECGQEYSE